MSKALQSHLSDRRRGKALDDAEAKGWTVVDMKNEWNRLFTFEKL